MAKALTPLAANIASEEGLILKLWLEDRKSGRAGGIYLVEDAATAERCRTKHEKCLAVSGHQAVEVLSYPINDAPRCR